MHKNRKENHSNKGTTKIWTLAIPQKKKPGRKIKKREKKGDDA